MATTPFGDSQVYQSSTTITSSAVLTSGTNIFQVVGDGVKIEDVVVESDATGLATGTLFQIKKTDPVGNPIIFSQAVANLGANATYDLSTATIKNRSTVGNGYYLTHSSTVAACTGAGTVKVTILYRRLNSNSTIQPV